jgi:thymidylate kinase
MLVEFIGCTGAGKTTIACRVIKQLQRAGVEFELLDVGGRMRCDLIALPTFIRYRFHNRKLCCLARETLHVQAESLLVRLNLYRNFAKKVGMFHRLKNNRNKRNIIWDEGTVHAAHNLFVDSYSAPDVSRIQSFARLVPLPDLIIYVRSMQPILIGRISVRGHKRVKEGKDISTFIKHAEQVFETLTSQERIRDNLVVIENNESWLESGEVIARKVTSCIIGRMYRPSLL